MNQATTILTCSEVEVVNQKAGDIYRYMNFNEIAEFVDIAEKVEV